MQCVLPFNKRPTGFSAFLIIKNIELYVLFVSQNFKEFSIRIGLNNSVFYLKNIAQPHLFSREGKWYQIKSTREYVTRCKHFIALFLIVSYTCLAYTPNFTPFSIHCTCTYGNGVFILANHSILTLRRFIKISSSDRLFFFLKKKGLGI